METLQHGQVVSARPNDVVSKFGHPSYFVTLQHPQTMKTLNAIFKVHPTHAPFPPPPPALGSPSSSSGVLVFRLCCIGVRGQACFSCSRYQQGELEQSRTQIEGGSYSAER